MEKKRRTFKHLKETMTARTFEDFCKRIANQYANSELHFSGSYFSEHENITKECFRTCLEYAIVQNFITEKTVDKIEKKSIANQKAHAKNAGESTKVYYAKLRKKRNEYILFLYSDSDIKSIAEDFANNPQITKKEFAEKYDISFSVLDVLLKKAFTENIVDDEICRKIERRSLAKDSSKRTKEFFERLWKGRKKEEDALN